MQKKKCPYCAEEIAEEAIVCKHCKSDLQRQQKKLKKINYTGAIIFFSILFLILLGIAGGTNSNISSSNSGSSSDSISSNKYYEPTACSIHSYVANAVVEMYAKYPDEADIPLCTQAMLTDLGSHEYLMSGYISAPNSFGVMDRIYYQVELKYKGGSTSDLDNWEVIGDPVITTN